MEQSHRKNSSLKWFLAISLILHLLVVYLLREENLLTAPAPHKPMIVEVVPPRPQPQRPKERELELPPEPKTKRTRPAKRLGPTDHQVAKETAPKGNAPDESRASRRAPMPAPAKPSVPAPARPAPQSRPKLPSLAQGEKGTPTPKPTQRPANRKAVTAPPVPPLNSLLKLPQTAMSRINSEERHKLRNGVAQGDTVWLDTEQDLLISFFRRFKTNIYGVWNYPSDAAQRGEQGYCLLKITINHDGGTVANVEVVRSSGYPILDKEAVRAVKQGAPYGSLPSAYPNKVLKLMAYFRYTLNGVYVFGE
ncbi:MAG TPA: TonB family protein [Desulfuromonadales bacterium]|nr:TonB family protein [Desulfuromonadales bacterium]